MIADRSHRAIDLDAHPDLVRVADRSGVVRLVELIGVEHLERQPEPIERAAADPDERLAIHALRGDGKPRDPVQRESAVDRRELASRPLAECRLEGVVRRLVERAVRRLHLRLQSDPVGADDIGCRHAEVAAHDPVVARELARVRSQLEERLLDLAVGARDRREHPVRGEAVDLRTDVGAPRGSRLRRPLQANAPEQPLEERGAVTTRRGQTALQRHGRIGQGCAGASPGRRSDCAVS